MTTTTSVITPEMVKSWSPCIDITPFGTDPVSVMDVLTRKDGPWASLKHEYRLWVVLREELIDAKTLRLFAAWCARQALTRERVVGREPDPRSWTACDVAERFANGTATADELENASFDAWAAAWSAVISATRSAQLEQLKAMLQESGVESN